MLEPHGQVGAQALVERGCERASTRESSPIAMATHTHLPLLRESRIMFDPYRRRGRARDGLLDRVSGWDWWLFLSHETHVYVGHEPGPCVAEPWVSLRIPVGVTAQPASWRMVKCLELAHAFVEP